MVSATHAQDQATQSGILTLPFTDGVTPASEYSL